MSAPDYPDVAAALNRLDCDDDAAEVHGSLCGRLCASSDYDLGHWLATLGPAAADAGNVLAREALNVMRALYDETVRQLNDPELGFQPLLPGDEADLSEQVAALSDWSQSYLIGLSEGGITDFSQLEDEAREFAHDLADISRMASSYDISGESEDDAAAFAEVLEYVRVGVLLINELRNPVTTPPANNITLH